MPSERAAGLPQRVLLVEDDRVVRSAMTRLLELEGFGVDAAASLAEGCAKLDGQPIVVLDLNLPDGIGTEILARARKHEQWVRVAIVSAADVDTLDNARRYNPDTIMSKPIDVAAFLRWLREDPRTQADSNSNPAPAGSRK